MSGNLSARLSVSSSSLMMGAGHGSQSDPFHAADHCSVFLWCLPGRRMAFPPPVGDGKVSTWMSPEAHRMITVSFGNYEAYCQADGMPSPEVLAEFEQRAALTERLGMEFRGADGFCAVRRRGNEWPFLVVTQRYAPAGESGFHLGLVVVPETHRLFLGAGCRLLAYDLSAPARLRASQPGRTRRC